MTVTVLMLKTLAIQRGAPRGGADQKPAGLAIARRPGKIANALKAEHRIKDVKRHHGEIGDAVGGRGSQPRGERACLVDALLENLPGLGFFVVEDTA
ncbi:MAG: Uncharacterised protein [Halieaceae bacterium]|nr:MAG: Uncharacterised protein [Halieaceae bacterium]